MELKIFNNLSRKKETFEPITKGEVKFYSCGPTTYGFLHVGNARALVVGDMIHRLLKSFGYRVIFVRNFTDVDDKIINAANERGIDPLVHSKEFTDECLKDMASLNMEPATHIPTVSGTMPEIISFIEKLIEVGYGYVVEGEVFFDVPKFEGYGKLSKKKLDDLQHGVRVAVDSKKKSSPDFVLWKPAKEGEPSWDSPWGKGRPGWHIECSAMAKKFLGESIDIHHGGTDLMFPHHENEIAQSEAANEKPFSKYWCHNEMLNMGSEKMSKSLGNILTMRKFIESYGGEVLRQVLMSAHYRSKMEWSDEVIKRGIEDCERLHKFVLSLDLAKEKNFSKEDSEESSKLAVSIKNTINDMKMDLANDFNVPGAAGTFFSFVRTLNRECLDESGQYKEKIELTKELVQIIDDTVTFFKEVTGLIHSDPKAVLTTLAKSRQALSGKSGGASDSEVEELLVQRKEARASKDFAKSDEIRDKLKEMGVKIKDNPDGTTSWSF